MPERDWQGDLRQRDEHGRALTAGEQDPEDDPDHDDERAGDDVQPERLGPRAHPSVLAITTQVATAMTAPSRSGFVVRLAATVKSERPQPPGQRMQRPRQPAGPRACPRLSRDATVAMPSIQPRPPSTASSPTPNSVPIPEPPSDDPAVGSLGSSPVTRDVVVSV